MLSGYLNENWWLGYFFYILVFLPVLKSGVLPVLKPGCSSTGWRFYIVMNIVWHYCDVVRMYQWLCPAFFNLKIRLSCKLWFWLHFLKLTPFEKGKVKISELLTLLLTKLSEKKKNWKIISKKEHYKASQPSDSILLPTSHRFWYFEVWHVSVPKLNFPK